MKGKLTLFITAALIPLCTAVRVLQYLFVTDADGFFRPKNGAHHFLIHALTALLTLAALYALALMFTRDRSMTGVGRIKCNLSGFISAALGLVLIAEAGISLGRAFTGGGALTVAGILELPAGAYFCVLGFTALSGGRVGSAVRILGLFPALYVVSFAISEFFVSFKDINLSKAQIDMLTLCAAALFVFALCGAFAGMNVSLKRMRACSLLCALFASVSALPEIIMLAIGRASVDSPLTFWLQTAVKLLLAALAVTALAKAEPKMEYADEPEQEQSGKEDGGDFDNFFESIRDNNDEN